MKKNIDSKSLNKEEFENVEIIKIIKLRWVDMGRKRGKKNWKKRMKEWCERSYGRKIEKGVIYIKENGMFDLKIRKRYVYLFVNINIYEKRFKFNKKEN